MKDSKNHIFNLFFSLLNFLLQLQKVNQRALLFGSLVNLFPRERNSFLSNRQFFKNLPIRNNNCLWRPCLLTDWDKMSKFYKGPSIDASYQVSVHLAEGHGRHRPFLFLIGRFLKISSPLKPHSQMNCNFVGSLYGRFSINIAHLVPIH
jgi:hypothetical protein